MLEPRTLMAANWQNVQIGGGGYVTGLAASSDGSAIYMRTDVGGAYRWDAANAGWRAITDSLPMDTNNNGHLYGINSIAVDPGNSNRVFIATGKYNWSNPSGIYYSTNTDAATPTWTVIDSGIRALANGDVRQNGERLLVDPANSNVIYYGTNNVAGGGTGLRKYWYDTSWHGSTLATPALGDANYGITFVAADASGGTLSDGTRTVSKYLYIGVYSNTAGSGGVYASSDGGATWTLVSGVTVDKPYRGEVGTDGTLYVTYAGGVTRLSRGSTAFTSITPPGGNTDFCSLAVDPAIAGTVMVADFTFSGTGRVWRSLDSGTTWVLMNRSIHSGEPDGTRSATGNGTPDHVSDLLINPANLDEVWSSDFLGVMRTQNIKDDATAISDWYMLQRGHEEVCVLDLKSAPDGSPLLSGVADVNGFVHNNPDVRPTPNDRFDLPTYLSTTSVDFGESTSGATRVWARVGDLYYTTNTDSDRTGGISIDDGQTWAAFGQLDSKTITNSSAAGWETFDVGPYLRQQKLLGNSTVTLILRAGAWQTNQYYLHFSSREGINAPQVVIDGSTTLSAIADAMVYKGTQTTNYGNTAELQAQNYYDQNSYTRWSFLKFDLSSLSSISSATLRLYRLGRSDTYSFLTSIYASPTTSWVEGNGGADNNPLGEITWGSMPTDLYAPPAGATGGRIAISATDPGKLVWLAESGYVYYSKDRGVSWARGMYGASGLSADALSEFAMDKVALASDRVAADTFYLYSKTGGGTVYRSTDGGATWSMLVSSIGTANQYKIETLPGVGGRFWYVDQNWNVAAHFKYWNGSAMVNVAGISGVVDFAFGRAVPGTSNPVVFARKADGTYWFSTDTTAGVSSTWTKMNVAVIGAQPSVMEGDRQSVGRVYVGTGGRGIFYADAPITWDQTPPTLSSVTIGDGNAQRSMVKTIDIAFDEDVTLASDALSLTTRGGATLAGVTPIVSALDGHTYRLSFTGAAVVGGSLPDGIYRLVIRGASVRDLADNAMTLDQTRTFHRLFGDSDGDRDVDAADLYRFKQAMKQYVWYFDFDSNLQVNGYDYLQLKQRLVRRALL